MIEYKVEMYENCKEFSNDLNAKANIGYVLHSFQKCDNVIHKYIAVFYKEIK